MKEAFDLIKERLEDLINEPKCLHEYDDCCDGLNEAIKIVSEVEAEYGNGWIPVEKALPEDGVDVIVQFEYYRYGDYNCMYKTKGIGTYFHGNWLFINGSTGWNKLKVFAWQPLPDDYKPEKGE